MKSLTGYLPANRKAQYLSTSEHIIRNSKEEQPQKRPFVDQNEHSRFFYKAEVSYLTQIWQEILLSLKYSG